MSGEGESGRKAGSKPGPAQPPAQTACELWVSRLYNVDMTVTMCNGVLRASWEGGKVTVTGPAQLAPGNARNGCFLSSEGPGDKLAARLKEEGVREGCMM